MCKHKDIIENWSEKYLDTLELIYGPIETHPYKAVEEINMEWIDSFMIDPGFHNISGFNDWTQNFMDVYETLYSIAELHKPMDVKEMNELLIEIFFEERKYMDKKEYAA